MSNPIAPQLIKVCVCCTCMYLYVPVPTCLYLYVLSILCVHYVVLLETMPGVRTGLPRAAQLSNGLQQSSLSEKGKESFEKIREPFLHDSI